MKNFAYLPDQHFSHFQNIANSKNNTVKKLPNQKKATLISMFDEIKTKYEYYESNFDATKLHLVQSAAYIGIQKESLLDAYLGNGKQLDQLKASIKKIQHQDWQNICPYCGIQPLNSTDHYLPKEDYSEYAVFALNLIPCCLECNNKKGTYWKAETKRTIINFYLDTIPTEEFLTCELAYNDKTPSTIFRLVHADGVDLECFKLIETHFTRLNLLERYKDSSNEEITNTFDSIVSYSTKTEPDKIKEDIESNHKKMIVRYGTNHWRCALLKALYCSDTFLNETVLAIKSKLIAEMVKI